MTQVVSVHFGAFVNISFHDIARVVVCYAIDMVSTSHEGLLAQKSVGAVAVTRLTLIIEQTLQMLKRIAPWPVVSCMILEQLQMACTSLHLL